MISSIKLINFLFSSFLLFNLIKCEDETSGSCFRAGVYEHIRINEPADKPLKVLNNNFAIIERVIKRASFFETKVIVLPEYVLLSNSLKRDELLSKGVVPILPNLNSNLCAVYKAKLKNITESNLSDIQKGEQLKSLDKETEQISEKILINKAILRKLSCLATDNKIYIAINLITLENKNSLKDLVDEQSASEPNDDKVISSELDTLKQSDQLINEKLTDQLNKINQDQNLKNLNSKIEDYLLFNTELVFDSDGRLIANYKKFNLFNEKQLNRTDLKLSTFKTPFGKFGIALCADILFEQPIKDLVEKEKIDHLIFSTAWFMDLPTLAGLDLQTGIAAKYGKTKQKIFQI